jgi:hypothetical protein
MQCLSLKYLAEFGFLERKLKSQIILGG